MKLHCKTKLGLYELRHAKIAKSMEYENITLNINKNVRILCVLYEGRVQNLIRKLNKLLRSLMQIRWRDPIQHLMQKNTWLSKK